MRRKERERKRRRRKRVIRSRGAGPDAGLRLQTGPANAVESSLLSYGTVI